MTAKKLRFLLSYLTIEDKVPRHQERLMGFPASPKAVEKLVREAIDEVYELERLAKIGLAIEKVFEEKGIISLPDKTPMNQTRGVIGGIDLEDIEQLLIWAESEE